MVQITASEALSFLHVESTITKDELTKLYRKLAFKYHPDTGGSHELFVKLNECYEYLINMVPFKSKQNPFYNISGFFNIDPKVQDMRNEQKKFFDDITKHFAQQQQRYNNYKQQQYNNYKQQSSQKKDSFWKISARGNSYCKFNDNTYIIYKKNDIYKLMIVDDFTGEKKYINKKFDDLVTAQGYVEKLQK